MNFVTAAETWDHYVDGNPPRLSGTLKRVSTGETTKSPSTVYSVLPSSISSLSLKQLIPPELGVRNIPFSQRQCVCVFWKVSWFWVTWSWSAKNLLETSSWLLCKDKQSIFRAFWVGVTCRDVNPTQKGQTLDLFKLFYFVPKGI